MKTLRINGGSVVVMRLDCGDGVFRSGWWAELSWPGRGMTHKVMMTDRAAVLSDPMMFGFHTFATLGDVRRYAHRAFL